MLSVSSLAKRLLLRPLMQQKKAVVLIFFAVGGIALSQSVLVVLFGPFIKALFQVVKTPYLTGEDLFSLQMIDFLPFLKTVQIETKLLSYLVPLSMLIAALIRSIAVYFYEKTTSALSFYVVSHYRKELFSQILQMPFVLSSQKSPGTWMSRIMNDVILLQNRFAEIIRSLLQDSIVIFSSLITLFLIHYPTAIFLIALMPFVARKAGKTGKKISHYAFVYQKTLAYLAAHMLDLRKRFAFIRAQQAENFELNIFDQKNEAYVTAIRQSIFVRALFAPIVEFAGFFIFAALIFFSFWQKKTYGFDGVNLFTFLATLGILLRPLKNIGEQYTRFHETKGALEESLSVFSVSESERIISRAASAPQVKDLLITSMKVRPDSHLIFSFENIHIPFASSVAVIGPSGAGKSSLIKALAGLYPVEEFVANRALSDVTTSAAFVSQSPFLFESSIEENLFYPQDVHKNHPLLEQSLTAALIKEEVFALPKKLETYLHPMRMSLSGGQVQRLVIARALLKDFSILLLDEATSAIDGVAEKKLWQSLMALSKKRGFSLLAVTHRLECLEDFDQVYFVKEGQIVLRGSYQEIKDHPLYVNFSQTSSPA